MGISLSTVSRYVKLKACGKDLAPKPSTGRKVKILDSLTHKKRALWRQLEENDIATLEVHCEMFEKEQGISLRGDDEPRGEEAGVDFQKRSMASSEGDEQRRSASKECVSSIVSERFVFVDECSTNIALSPIYARAPRGEERAPGKVPRNWAKNISLICAIDAEGVKSSVSVEGAVDGKAFESYIEHFLIPELKGAQTMVMDNLSVHKSKRAEQLIEEAGAQLPFLPPTLPQPHRGSLLQGEGLLEEGAGTHEGGSRGSNRPGPEYDLPVKTSAAFMSTANTVYLCSRSENRSNS